MRDCQIAQNAMSENSLQKGPTSPSSYIGQLECKGQSGELRKAARKALPRQ